ncbi:MAG: glycosyltransferase family 4 protein [Anaerolineales bacterium]|nr:glycosyltransferase family 4 protein [Anaerolineales bacterium]
MERETLKIIYFSKNYTPHDYRFLSSLSKTKHEIFFLQLESTQRQTEDRPVPANVRQILWAGGRSEFRWRDVPRLTFDLRRLTKEIKPDIIHAGPIQNCAFLVALSEFRHLLAMSWGYDLVMEADKNAWMRWITSYTLRRSAFFTCDANVTREKAVAFGMNPERTVVFPWGIDLEKFKPKGAKSGKEKAENGTRKAEGRSHQSKIVNRKSVTLFCSRTWEAIYGVDVLARAFVMVANENPHVNLILLGGGSQGNQIRQILMKGGVMERVHFGGQVGQRDLPRWYHMADVYISPSRVDGSSVTLMEAMASGLPCLVSDIAGNKEWIEDGVNGWLFRDGDVEDLVGKILLAIKKRGEFGKIGELARRTAEARADWRRNFGTLLEVYEKVKGN